MTCCTPEAKHCHAEAGSFTRRPLANRATVFTHIQACRNESKSNSCMKTDQENHKALKRFASETSSDYNLPFVIKIFDSKSPHIPLKFQNFFFFLRIPPPHVVPWQEEMSCRALPREVLHVPHLLPQLPAVTAQGCLCPPPRVGHTAWHEVLLRCPGINEAEPGWDSRVFVSPSSAFSRAFANLTPQMSALSSLPLRLANCCLFPSVRVRCNAGRMTISGFAVWLGGQGRCLLAETRSRDVCSQKHRLENQHCRFSFQEGRTGS